MQSCDRTVVLRATANAAIGDGTIDMRTHPHLATGSGLACDNEERERDIGTLVFADPLTATTVAKWLAGLARSIGKGQLAFPGITMKRYPTLAIAPARGQL